MHTIKLVEKAYIMQVDCESVLGTAVLENIVIINGKKHSHNKVSFRIFIKNRSKFKKITIFTGIPFSI